MSKRSVNFAISLRQALGCEIVYTDIYTAKNNYFSELIDYNGTVNYAVLIR